MIVDNGTYYLYRHIRLDKNEPFYIGVGTKPVKYRGGNNYKSCFKRAFAKDCRCPIWYNIVAHTKYEVEILLQSNSYSFIKQKEIEFVKLYGKIKNNTGILANITDGGDGQAGFSHKKESIEKAKATRKKNGYKISEESRQKLSISQKNRPGLKEFLAELRKNITPEQLEKGRLKRIGYKHSDEMRSKMREIALNRGVELNLKIGATHKKAIFNSLTNETYDSLKDCCEKLNLHKSELSRNLNNKTRKNKYKYLSYIKTKKE